jgi:steroid delta-isomerase-like uncharacterized protein
MADHREMARSALEAFSTGKLDVLDQVIAADCVVHDSQNPLAADHRGPKVAKEQVTMYRAVFPDLAMTVEDQYEDGDVVVSRWTATGTQNGDMPMQPATGQYVTVTGILIDRFEGDQIVEIWSNWDTLGMLQQLAAVPTAQDAPAA